MPMDTAEYLTSQGWKGKGTALKHGHVTRPLAVVQKKTLGGVGKDRDEAVPFWDNIFAAAAINIKVSSEAPTPVTSGTATPVEDDSPAPSKHSSMNAFARGKKEMARRLLYSKFFRGDVLVSEDLDKIPVPSSSAPSTSNGMEAGSSTLLAAARGITSSLTSSSGTGTPDTDAAEPVNATSSSSSRESAEEKARRKAEKASKKAAKAEAKAAKVVKKEAKARKRAEKADHGSLTSDDKKERRKGKDKRKLSEVALSANDAEGKEKKKRKRSQVDSVQEQSAGDGEDTETPSSRKKKKKREIAE